MSARPVRARLLITHESGELARNRAFVRCPEVGETIQYLGQDLLVVDVVDLWESGMLRPPFTHAIRCWLDGPWSPMLCVGDTP